MLSSLDIVLPVRRELAERNFAFVESELNQERAAALGRAVRKVEVHFERCHELRALLDGPDGSDLVDEYREARAAFEHARWQLCVHREAIGLNNHRWIDSIFPMPPRR